MDATALRRKPSWFLEKVSCGQGCLQIEHMILVMVSVKGVAKVEDLLGG